MLKQVSGSWHTFCLTTTGTILYESALKYNEVTDGSQLSLVVVIWLIC